MIIMGTRLDVADNTGAKKVAMIGVIGRSGTRTAEIGDVISCSVKEAAPVGEVKKGEAVRGVIVRTAYPILRKDGTVLRFDHNALVLIDKDGNPRGTRVFGPVARELRRKNYMKIVSLAPEVV